MDAHRNIITSISNDSIQDDIYDNFHQVRRPFSHIIQHNNTRKSLSSLTQRIKVIRSNRVAYHVFLGSKLPLFKASSTIYILTNNRLFHRLHMLYWSRKISSERSILKIAQTKSYRSTNLMLLETTCRVEQSSFSRCHMTYSAIDYNE